MPNKISTLQLKSTAWPKFNQNNRNTGLSPYSSYTDGTLRWTWTLSWIIRTSPSIDSDRTIYVGSQDGNMYAINPDGTLKWSFSTGYGFDYSSAAIDSGGTIYIANFDTLYAFNPDGTVKWTYTTSPYNLFGSSPAIDSDGTIYIGSNDGNLYAFNPDGTIKWSITLGNILNSSPAIEPDGTIYVVDENSTLYAINPDGTLNWSYTIDGYVSSAPSVGSDGTIYIGVYSQPNSYLYAMSPDGRTEKWIFLYPVFGGTYHITPGIGPDGTIYIGNSGGDFYAINSSDGSLKWLYPSGGSFEGSSPVISANGIIYIGSTGGTMYAFNPDGTIRWSYNPGDGTSFRHLSIGPDGEVYAGAVPGTNGISLYVFGSTPPGTLDISSTPSGASISIDGVPQGVTTDTIITDVTADTHTALLTLPGYIDRIITFDIVTGQTTTISTTLSPISSLITDVRCASHKFHRDLRNTGQSIYPSYTDGTIKWTYLIKTSVPWSINVRGSPAIDVDGTIYIGETYGGFFAINPDRTLKWYYPAGGGGYSSPVISPIDGTIYTIGRNVNTGLSGVYAFNPDGTLKWFLQLDSGYSETSPAIDTTGNIYVGIRKDTGGGYLYKINPSGVTKWEYYDGGSYSHINNNCPAISPIDGTIYAKVADDSSYTYVYAFNPSNGSVLWSTDVLGNRGGRSQSPSIAEDGTIYIALGKESDCYLYAINPTDGTINWQYRIGTYQTESYPAIATDGTIYIGNNDSNDYRMYAINPNGTLKWFYPVRNDSRSPPTIDLGGNIYFGTNGTWDPTLGYSFARFYSLNPEGTLRWYKDIPTDNSIVSSPSIAPDGTIYVGVDENPTLSIGGLVAFQSTYIAPPPLAPSPAPLMNLGLVLFGVVIGTRLLKER